MFQKDPGNAYQSKLEVSPPVIQLVLYAWPYFPLVYTALNAQAKVKMEYFRLCLNSGTCT